MWCYAAEHRPLLEALLEVMDHTGTLTRFTTAAGFCAGILYHIAYTEAGMQNLLLADTATRDLVLKGILKAGRQPSDKVNAVIGLHRRVLSPPCGTRTP